MSSKILEHSRYLPFSGPNPDLGLTRAIDLREGNQSEAAGLIEQQARLLGQAQYAGVQYTWSSVAPLIEQAAILEERLLAVLRSW